MKVAVITDQHFGVRSDSTIFLDYYEKFYSDVFFPTIDKLGIDTVIDLGDTFDRRKYINFVTLARAKRMYFDELHRRGIKIHSIVGNHSVYFKNTNEVNSMELLLPEYDQYVTYTHEPVELDLDGCKVMLSPWICAANAEVSYKAFKETTAKILMGHFEFAGVEMMKGQLATHGLDKTDFKKFESIYSGHYHHPSVNDNITYLGAPYEMTWTDYGGKRGFHIFDTETLDMKFIRNPYSIYHKLTYDDHDLTVEDVAALDTSMLTSTYVKVIVKAKTNPYVFDLFIDKLQASGCADVKIIEDHMNFESVTTDEVIDEAQDTVSLLKAYIDSLDVKADKDRLNAYVRTLYQEAINL